MIENLHFLEVKTFMLKRLLLPLMSLLALSRLSWWLIALV